MTSYGKYQVLILSNGFWTKSENFEISKPFQEAMSESRLEGSFLESQGSLMGKQQFISAAKHFDV